MDSVGRHFALMYCCSYENCARFSLDPAFRPLDIDIGTCTAAESRAVSDGAFSNTEELIKNIRGEGGGGGGRVHECILINVMRWHLIRVSFGNYRTVVR